MKKYQVTGNEYVSLPTIREADGAAEGVTFLYMRAKGMLEIRGGEALCKPSFSVNGQPVNAQSVWQREHFWIPVMTQTQGRLRFSCTYLTPLGERGFVLRLAARNDGEEAAEARLCACGDWDQTLHQINETKQIKEGRSVRLSGWNHMFVWEQSAGLPLFAFAPITEDNQAFSVGSQGAKWIQNGYAYEIFKDVTLLPGCEEKLEIYFGLGYEEVAAATSAKEMLRQGYGRLHQGLSDWLQKREKRLSDPHLNTLLNTNMFFAFFYASGRTVDTEELCLMTSRSPRYYVSAAYWDRDSLLWAFPAILMADPAYAREILDYVFEKQARNFGVHSRYIDGTVLEPGFELDELCAPVIALERYVQATEDHAYLKERHVQKGIEKVLCELQKHKHPKIDLYDTFLQPTDDMHNYPYLTYDNALVSKALRFLGRAAEAERVKKAILKHMVVEAEGKAVFAWSADLQGSHDIYDEPPGSLQLLSHYGFIDPDEQVFQNTLFLIRSSAYRFSFVGCPIAEIGCEHAPHPWVLSICNSLLSGHASAAIAHLRRTTLDNGVACESVDEYTGLCATGEAFATCAGFLAYALWQAGTAAMV